ncbi:MAG: hypothetical protein ACK6D1_01035 [Planctomycetota bacterium]
MTTRPRPATRLALALAAVAALGAGSAGCGRNEAVEHRLLALDGLEITLADVAPYVAFYDSFLPEGGRKSQVLRALDDLLIPLLLARRAFPAERERMRRSAAELCSVATNAHELDQQSQQVKDRRRSNLTRSSALLPVAMHVFDPARVGAVSPPIELPHGWFVVGVFDLQQSPGLVMADYVDALQVGFVTHTSAQFMAWYREQQRQLADKATFVHPDYEHAMPSWLRVPPRK